MGRILEIFYTIRWGWVHEITKLWFTMLTSLAAIALYRTHRDPRRVASQKVDVSEAASRSRNLEKLKIFTQLKLDEFHKNCAGEFGLLKTSLWFHRTPVCLHRKNSQTTARSTYPRRTQCILFIQDTLELWDVVHTVPPGLLIMLFFMMARGRDTGMIHDPGVLLCSISKKYVDLEFGCYFLQDFWNFMKIFLWLENCFCSKCLILEHKKIVCDRIYTSI